MGSCSPFGFTHRGYNSIVRSYGNNTAQKFGFNGKEFEEALGVNLMEMDVRQFDPIIARWTSIDPITHHSQSTYNGFDNNPIYFADPSGADGEPTNGFGVDLFGRSEYDEYGNFIRASERQAVSSGSSSSTSSDCDDFCKAYAKFRETVIKNGGVDPEMKDASNYDYSIEHEMFDSEKGDDDWDYIKNGEVGTMLGRYIRILRRDWNADKEVRKDLNVLSILAFRRSTSINLRGGKTFKEYKDARGGTRTLTNIQTSSGVQRISIEYHHVFLTQRLQRRLNLPNWLVNNRINVWRMNTVQHALLDKYRFKFLRASFKKDVGWFKKYNWFTRF
ncbi:RHS repeat-associated core domain-containing protein [Tenacibaculum agarivorans]|uniref:RHS repeat-associated core domain-containing protein n=1 Tax=Tenacibaculum agarivorans TaxID=1908389 RepID=UPI00094B9C1B|nr:RHS repeat-associated core domain-containing protein [Tenacibaculum agarivorans]